MLEVLLGEGVRNVAVVVTRYFGGVLLGTGGLVRAYSSAVKEGIDASKIGTMRYGVRLKSAQTIMESERFNTSCARTVWKRRTRFIRIRWS